MCLTPETFLHLRRGVVPAAGVCIGDQVLACDGSWCRIEAMRHRHVSMLMTAVRTHRSTDLFCTASEALIPAVRGIRPAGTTVDPIEVRWVLASELTADDYLLLPASRHRTDTIDVWPLIEGRDWLEADAETIYQCLRHHTGIRIRGAVRYGRQLTRRADSLSPFWTIVGYYLAEGDVNRLCGQVRFAFHEDEVAYHRELISALNQMGYQASVLKTKQRCVRITVYSRLLGKALEALCPGIARGGSKRLHPDVMGLPDAALWLILAAYFKGDGHSARGQEVWTVTTSSRTLAEQIRMVLGRFRIPSSLRSWQCGARPGYSLWVFGGEATALLEAVGDAAKRRYHFRINPCCPKRFSIRVGETAMGYRVKSAVPLPYTGLLYDIRLEGGKSLIPGGFAF